MKQLTEKQRLVYECIVTFQKQNGYPPSVREIAQAVGLKSPSTVQFHLNGLEQAGMIEKREGKTRTISVVKKGAPPVHPAPPEPPKNQVPLVGSVAAGTPILAEECIEEYIPFDTNGRRGEHFALIVRGESMRDAGILPGDYVIVRQQMEFRNGDIVVALFEDEATVKTYHMDRGHLWLLPENPDYQPIDGEGCQLLGRVVGLQRNY